MKASVSLMHTAAALLVLTISTAHTSSDVGTGTGTDPTVVGIVWFGRADVPATAYSPLLTALRAESPNSLVVAAGTDPAAAALALRKDHNVTSVVVAAHSMEPEAGVAAQAFVAARAAQLGITRLVLISGDPGPRV